MFKRWTYRFCICFVSPRVRYFIGNCCLIVGSLHSNRLYDECTILNPERSPGGVVRRVYFFFSTFPPVIWNNDRKFYPNITVISSRGNLNTWKKIRSHVVSFLLKASWKLWFKSKKKSQNFAYLFRMYVEIFSYRLDKRIRDEKKKNTFSVIN